TGTALAWELFRLLLVDLVISEVALPQVDGIEFTRQIRTLPLFQNVPILLLSDALDEETMAQGWKAGASEWLERPVSDSQLLSLTAEMLAGRTGFDDVVPMWRPVRRGQHPSAFAGLSAKRKVG
ncbi:MAG: response regulator, partial [Verrucomicrobia bacterium]|nr:response regulator [Verrucomicrobiota bacterium]